MSSLRRYLIAGLLVWLPLGVTVFLIKIIIGLLDRTLLLLPPDWRPDAVLGIAIPGFGVFLAIALLLLTGMLVANFLGRRLVGLWEGLLRRIPLVRSIYSSVKQVTETIFSSKGESFRQVVLIEYPRKGMWSIAFLTNSSLGEVSERLEEDMVSVFLPTTPNPTSGFVLILPRSEITVLEMPIEDALRFVMSVGVVVPAWPVNQDGKPARVANGEASP